MAHLVGINSGLNWLVFWPRNGSWACQKLDIHRADFYIKLSRSISFRFSSFCLNSWIFIKNRSNPIMNQNRLKTDKNWLKTDKNWLLDWLNIAENIEINIKLTKINSNLTIFPWNLPSFIHFYSFFSLSFPHKKQEKIIFLPSGNSIEGTDLTMASLGSIVLSSSTPFCCETWFILAGEFEFTGEFGSGEVTLNLCGLSMSFWSSILMTFGL